MERENSMYTFFSFHFERAKHRLKMATRKKEKRFEKMGRKNERNKKLYNDDGAI